ncbi:hypothetical protein N7466_010710 [Penicillium verhagenii]|uniref:uncharacterized protein n=1 Tax=Penicillium verhagenii TaxID=1562060 RepID=UPI0025452264|nr:uncharacterized protein N7466_010710 [Penicillium verhagenii]KAJ5917156.1 hypothetical protein N7466_010710 [Penicillium verhagenii]
MALVQAACSETHSSVQKLDTTVTATGPALQPPAAAPIPLPLRGLLAPRSRPFSPVRNGDENEKSIQKRARLNGIFYGISLLIYFGPENLALLGAYSSLCDRPVSLGAKLDY